MTEFLVRHFVKDYENTSKVSVRTAYGVLASVTGIFCNILLFAAKWLIGYLLHSISVMADGFNNLSDAGSSMITLVGFKLSGQKPDTEGKGGNEGQRRYSTAIANRSDCVATIMHRRRKKSLWSRRLNGTWLVCQSMNISENLTLGRRNGG